MRTNVERHFVGPHAEETSGNSELHIAYLPARGLKENGKHHEIYLSDPRKVASNKLKSIIRQPVKKCG